MCCVENSFNETTERKKIIKRTANELIIASSTPDKPYQMWMKFQMLYTTRVLIVCSLFTIRDDVIVRFG